MDFVRPESLLHSVAWNQLNHFRPGGPLCRNRGQGVLPPRSDGRERTMKRNERSPSRWITAWLLLPATVAWAQPVPQTMEITGRRIRPADSLALDQQARAGSRLGLTVMETPASVDVISSEQMRERGDRTTEQALQSAAGVVAGQCFGLTCFSMRGFANNLALPAMFDGLRYPGLAFTPRGTFIFDRIEVIKGPASVLHGLGSVGGAINFVTKPANGQRSRELFVAYDRWNTANLGLGLGGGDVEGLAWRFDVNAISAGKGSSGWVDRSGYTYTHGAAEVAWKVTPALRATLSAQALDDHGDWYFGTPLVAGAIESRVRFKNYNVSDSQVRKRAQWLRAGIEYDITPNLRLRNETYGNSERRAYRNAEVNEHDPLTGRVELSDFLQLAHSQDLVGNRTDLNWDHALGGMRNRVVVGFDWSRNRHGRTTNSPYATGPVSVDFLDPVAVPFSTASPFLPLRRTVVDQRAVFVEDMLSLTQKAKLSMSLRHDGINLDSHDLRAASSFDRHWNALSWRLGGLYDMSPTLTAYAQWSRAFEPPAQIVTLTAAQRDFNLSRARQAEVGLKGHLPGRTGEFTVSYFDVVRNDLLTRDPDSPARTIQIGQQSSRGVEFDVAWRHSATWSFGANGTWLRARYDHFTESVRGAPVSRAGNVPPDTPERVGNVLATWRPHPAFRLRGNLRHVGARPTNNANTVFMPAYNVMDLSVAVSLPVGEAGLKLRNAADKVYATRSYGSGHQVLLGEPRAVEVSYSAKF